MTRPEKWPDGACWCGAEGDAVHPYAEGLRCDEHSPWARAGQPPPGKDRYCMADGVCYCGECGTPPAPLAPVRDTVLDRERIRKGQRRASPEAYREARDHPRDRR